MEFLTTAVSTLLVCLTAAFVSLGGLFMILLALPGTGSRFLSALAELRQSREAKAGRDASIGPGCRAFTTTDALRQELAK